jgi:rod shape-determining protein MreC
MLLGVLLVIALALIAVSYSDGASPVLRGVKTAAGTVFGGLERAASAMAGPGSGGRAASLQRQVVRLRAQLSQAQLSRADYAQLRRLLQLSGQGGYKIVTANVIAAGQGYQQTVTLDAGSADGISAGETVLDGQGLLGEVTAVTGQTATVQLATGAGTVIGVRLAPSGDIGWVSGQGKSAAGTGLLRLQVLNTSAVLHPGEQLVTSASVRDRPYVPGVPVGTITKVVSNAPGQAPVALVRPYADFSSLSVAGVVIAPPRRDPRFAVLPPSPSPRSSPRPTVTVTVTPGASPPPAAGG